MKASRLPVGHMAVWVKLDHVMAGFRTVTVYQIKVHSSIHHHTHRPLHYRQWAVRPYHCLLSILPNTLYSEQTSWSSSSSQTSHRPSRKSMGMPTLCHAQIILYSYTFYRPIKPTKNVLSVTSTKHPLQEVLRMPRVLSSKKSALKPNNPTLPFVNVSVFN